MTTDLYLRRTAGNGRAIITHHFVWDAETFIASQQRDQRDLMAKGKEGQTITIATQHEYRAFAWPNHSSKER